MAALPVSIDDIPAPAAAASHKLRDAILSILGDDLVGMWLHGGTTFPDRPRQAGDLDICAAVDGITAEDNEVLRVTMAPFVEMVRERLPALEPRPPGPPRWS